MKLLIVDDEKLARDRLVRLLDDATDIQVIGQAASGIQAVTLCGEVSPDVVLLDIRMPGMDGLEAAVHMMALEEPPAIVFCTAYEEHAIEAFKVHAVGYLLKPVRREDLKEILINVRKTNKAQLAAIAESDGRHRLHLSARTRRGIELVAIEEVRFLQADQKYVTVRHKKGELLIDETLRDLELEFATQFIRVHRNSLVAVKHIAGLDRDENGHYEVRMDGVEERIQVSRRHISGVRKVVKNL